MDNQEYDHVFPGYKAKNKPDVGWWGERLAESREWTKKKIHHTKWDDWEKKYTNEDYSQFVNLFFMLERTMVPRTYFRNPSITASAAKPGPLHAGIAAVMERVDNKLIGQLDLKNTFKDGTGETFQRGTSWMKLGYGSEYYQAPSGDDTKRDTSKTGFSVEYRPNIITNMPWVKMAQADQVYPAAHIKRFDESPYFIHEYTRDVEEFKEDTRYPKKFRDNLGPDANPIDAASDGKARLITLAEVHDRRTRQWFLFAPYSGYNTSMRGEGDSLLVEPMADDLQSRHGGPFYPLVFNPVRSHPFGIPDSVILDPIQDEMDNLALSIMRHRRMSQYKFKYLRDEVNQDIINAFLNEVELTAVGVASMGSFEAFQLAGIPPELFAWYEKIMEIVRMTIGFSRNEFGEYRPGSEAPSATESMNVKRASGIRIDERRDALADLMLNITNDMNRIIFRNWNQTMVERVVGPFGVPIWVEFTGEMLAQGSFDLNIVPDSAAAETREQREAKAVQIFQLLYPLTKELNPTTQAPMIDADKLTTMLLHELKGVQYDDLKFGVPNIYTESYVRALTQGSAALNQTVGPEQLGSMLQQNPNGQAIMQMMSGMGQG